MEERAGEITAEFILQQFDIPTELVVNIYQYGSRVYGCHNEESDHDWVIVYKASMMPNGSFKNNAISSPDRKHQAICFSRSGFQSSIDYYDITALECMFLRPDQVIRNDMKFAIRKWDPKAMASELITKSSTSWHRGITDFHVYHDEEKGKKNVHHALRILGFGIQMAETGNISDYSAYNDLRRSIEADQDFTPKKYLQQRDAMMSELRLKTQSTETPVS